MKKTLSLILILFTICSLHSCNDVDDILVPGYEIPEQSMFISQMEAIELAEQMAAQLYRPTSRSEERHSSPFLCSTIRSNSSRGEDNEILHVVNFVDSMGYALVSTVNSR